VYSIDIERWNKLTIFEQMGNIYSEFGRSFSAKSRGDELSAHRAMTRCLELFDATINQLTAKQSVQAKEVSGARDQYLKLFNQANPDQKELQSLDKYFKAFAIVARLRS
jgi:hypothetical protein